MGHILIVDDEKSISDLIVMNLIMVGHTSEQAFDGREALEKLRAGHFDLCLLDIMLPGKDGFELIDDFIKSKVPVIFLSAKSSLLDRVKGLHLGAEDYIIKPFETLELIARIDVILRREGKDKNIFTCKNVVVDLRKHMVLKDEQVIDLTAQEYLLLEVLISNQNLALTREQLLSIAWGYDYSGETRTVDMHIQKLRKKLAWEDIIKTVYKFGYRLEVPGT